MNKTLNLFECATSRGRVIRHGELVQMVMDGSGAFVCAAQDFLTAQRWAQSKMASTNLLTDRGRFLEKIEVLVARPSSLVSTRGSQRPLETIARLMLQAGYDLSEWTLPVEVKDALKPKTPPAKPAPAAVPPTDESAATSLPAGAPDADRV